MWSPLVLRWPLSSTLLNKKINLQRHHLRERSLSVVNMFLDEMSKEAKNIITTICDEQCTMSDKVGSLICS